MNCLYCGAALSAMSADELPRRVRIAFDPALGRLWQVCAACSRWNAVPFEDRWEVLELCERSSDGARVLLESSRLALLQAGRTQLVRVGGPPRADFSVWRYSTLLDRYRAGGLSRRWLQLPDRPVGGAIGRDYHGGVVTVPETWIGSPFIEHGSLLTLLFTSVPLAERCPSCGGPLMLEPSRFGDLSFELVAGEVHVRTDCTLCGDAVDVPLLESRPALRTGLAIVNRADRDVDRVRLAVEPIDLHGDARVFVRSLARDRAALGSLHTRLRLALWLALDELAEADALETEWRRAEELASISDGELTSVPGFETFRRRVREDTTD